MLASLHGAKTLLGSATPTVETYYKAKETGKYGLVELTTRYGDVSLPDIELVDVARERQRKGMDGAFANSVIAAGRHTIEDGRQVIFFITVVDSRHVPDAVCVSLCLSAITATWLSHTISAPTLSNVIIAGLCIRYPRYALIAKEPTVEIEGYGTERVEEGLDILYPDSRILRMDLDTTRNKDSYSEIINQFSSHKADILVGTQMVTKGLDFGDVGLVAVINADNIINFPDFRSCERAFNMLEQVSGRAGRRAGAPGKVMIQTYTPGHPVLDFVSRHDYTGFMNTNFSKGELSVILRFQG